MKVQDALIHEAILQRFSTLKGRNRLAHAYMFIGPKDSGKGETALTVAQLLNCENVAQQHEVQPCYRCASCLKIKAGYHPDVLSIDSGEGESIKIEQIRQMLAQIQLRPFMAKTKVFIIKNSENLTIEAGNALLKVLEEPSQDSLILLTTSVPERNLDTIRSRCHAIHFHALTEKNIVAQLRKGGQKDPRQLQFFAHFTEGCLGKAQRYAQSQIIETKNRYINQFIYPASADKFIQEITKDQGQTKELADILLTWIRDCILLKRGVHEGTFVHADRLEDLKKFQAGFSFDELCDLHEEIVNAHRWCAENLNTRIPLMIIKEKFAHGKSR